MNIDILHSDGGKRYLVAYQWMLNLKEFRQFLSFTKNGIYWHGFIVLPSRRFGDCEKCARKNPSGHYS